MNDTIRITDLAAPRRTTDQVAVRALAERFPVEFDRSAILAEAQRRTGLEDFGPMDFTARLDLLCRAVDADVGLHAAGRAGLYFQFVRYAETRLRIQHTLLRHPEIHDEVIDRPVIVAGLPRSGTTHLLNLLASDRRFRSLPYWESCEPVPVPDEPPTVTGEDPRYTRCRIAWEQTDRLLPLLKAMHAMTPDHIHEELELMSADFASYNFEWLFTAPSWRDHYLDSDQTPHYEFLRTVLQLLQWQDRQRGVPTKRWVLKCPQHLEQLPVLMRTFGDATVAITHRDPTSVIASASTMLAYGDRIRRIEPDPPGVAAYWSDRAQILLSRCTQDRHTVPDIQSLDVRFDEFMADDVAMVERIYEVAGIEMTGDARSDLGRHMADHPRGAHGRIGYDLAEDFGIDRDQLRTRFEGYMTRFGVEPEA
ncbi:MAG TPA: sulfotransferase [Acidimicrobiales bacterium]|nr:sulfotransferase [Acidimicrobiales bacterium]